VEGNVCAGIVDSLAAWHMAHKGFLQSSRNLYTYLGDLSSRAGRLDRTRDQG
jgi:hypothetical protein